MGEQFSMTRSRSSRRTFLKSSTLAAAATALRHAPLLAQASTQADARLEIIPSEQIGTTSPATI